MAHVAMLVGDGFEDSEFQVPFQTLRDAGDEVVVLGREAGALIHGKTQNSAVEIDRAVADADPDEFDALVIPGGHGPDNLRIDAKAVEFTRRFVQSGKPVAAICHGPQLLIEAGVVKGQILTSWPSVRTDLENAGARWVDEPLVEDDNLITSRKPDDLDDFCEALLKRLHD